MTTADEYIDAHVDEALEQLRAYVAMPSVSAQKPALSPGPSPKEGKLVIEEQST